MEVVYAREPFPESFKKTIFLAGPTPRNQSVPSWRPEALKLLEEAGFDGVVFVPEPRGGHWTENYDTQIEWEETGLRMADSILFWVPREIETMPAFTTNDEWGFWKKSNKVVFGAPNEAVKVRYQRYYAAKYGAPNFYTLPETIRAAIEMCGDGAERTGGERFVPMLIWKSGSFQEWYRNLKLADNRLDDAKIEWTFVAPNSKFLVFWAMHVDVYVAAEKRHKTNEVVFSRPSVSSVVLFHRGHSRDSSKVVLVREFRSPVSNALGYVWELPGGSSFKPGERPEAVAASEVEEETGIKLDADRFMSVGEGQLAATLSGHHCYLFAVELTAEEIAHAESLKGQVFGNEKDSERTYVEVWTVGQLRGASVVDWSVKGMVLSVLAGIS